MKFNPREIKRINKQDRIWFIDRWADYVKASPDREWSRQQNILINSLIQNAKNLKMSPEEYLRTKLK